MKEGAGAETLSGALAWAQATSTTDNNRAENFRQGKRVSVTAVFVFMLMESCLKKNGPGQVQGP